MVTHYKGGKDKPLFIKVGSPDGAQRNPGNDLRSRIPFHFIPATRWRLKSPSIPLCKGGRMVTHYKGDKDKPLFIKEGLGEILNLWCGRYK